MNWVLPANCGISPSIHSVGKLFRFTQDVALAPAAAQIFDFFLLTFEFLRVYTNSI